MYILYWRPLICFQIFLLTRIKFTILILIPILKLILIPILKPILKSILISTLIPILILIPILMLVLIFFPKTPNIYLVDFPKFAFYKNVAPYSIRAASGERQLSRFCSTLASLLKYLQQSVIIFSWHVVYGRKDCSTNFPFPQQWSWKMVAFAMLLSLQIKLSLKKLFRGRYFFRQ